MPNIKLNLPADLAAVIDAAASNHGRSRVAEILVALSRRYKVPVELPKRGRPWPRKEVAEREPLSRTE